MVNYSGSAASEIGMMRWAQASSTLLWKRPRYKYPTLQAHLYLALASCATAMYLHNNGAAD